MTRALQMLGFLPSGKVVDKLVDSGVEGGRYIKAASLLQDLASFKKKQEEQKKSQGQDSLYSQEQENALLEEMDSSWKPSVRVEK
jgi:hypothetical protein